jgi:Cu-Zn family superoxide dismutase
MKNIALLTLMAIALVSCKDDKKTTTVEKTAETTEVKVTDDQSMSSIKKMTINLEPKSGSKAMGTVNVSEKDGNVVFEAKISGLDPGMHAIHFHEKADCSSDDGKSTGGHWNPTFENHGKWGADTGYHKGDIGNFKVGADGTGTITMITDEWCVGCGDEKKDILGKAVIVHQGEDDFTSQPSGAAGSRVSCGGVLK